jgi:hypothetical protein
MKNIFLLIQIIFWGNSYAQSVQNDSCDIKLLVSLESRITDLSNTDIHDFIETIDASCQYNVEFHEFYNELLFKITQRYPKDMLTNLSKTDNDQRQLILKEYSENTLDADIKSLIAAVKSIKGFDGLKKDIIKSVKKNN